MVLNLLHILQMQKNLQGLWIPLIKNLVYVRGIHKYSWQLPPVVPDYIPNPHPMKVKEGQRVCLNIKNHNADAHSMHLHGHSFQVVEIDGHSISGAMRDTVMTARGQCRILKVCFDAVHPGVWPFHCHMSFHLAAGMFTSVEYED